MKTLYIIFLSILSLQNCANKIHDKFPVRIIEAYHQYWIAGVQGGGSGRSLYITFEKELPNDIELGQLYFRKGLSKFHKISETEYLFSFQGDSNFERGNELESDVPLKAQTIEPPFKIEDNEAILEYIQKGEKKYFKISDIKEKEMLAYPSARPIGNDKN